MKKKKNEKKNYQKPTLYIENRKINSVHAIPNKTNSNHKSFCGMGADDELVYTLKNPHGILVKLPIHGIVNRVCGTLKMSEYSKRNTVIKSILHSLSTYFFRGRF